MAEIPWSMMYDEGVREGSSPAADADDFLAERPQPLFDRQRRRQGGQFYGTPNIAITQEGDLTSLRQQHATNDSADLRDTNRNLTDQLAQAHEIIQAQRELIAAHEEGIISSFDQRQTTPDQSVSLQKSSLYPSVNSSGDFARFDFTENTREEAPFGEDTISPFAQKQKTPDQSVSLQQSSLYPSVSSSRDFARFNFSENTQEESPIGEDTISPFTQKQKTPDLFVSLPKSSPYPSVNSSRDFAHPISTRNIRQEPFFKENTTFPFAQEEKTPDHFVSLRTPRPVLPSYFLKPLPPKPIAEPSTAPAQGKSLRHSKSYTTLRYDQPLASKQDPCVQRTKSYSNLRLVHQEYTPPPPRNYVNLTAIPGYEQRKAGIGQGPPSKASLQHKRSFINLPASPEDKKAMQNIEGDSPAKGSEATTPIVGLPASPRDKQRRNVMRGLVKKPGGSPKPAPAISLPLTPEESKRREITAAEEGALRFAFGMADQGRNWPSPAGDYIAVRNSLTRV
ncbi:MAG: hypothetical protein Q9164_004056, partial [Protoblastenia rupestris]